MAAFHAMDEDGLSQYLHKIQEFPMLTPEEEYTSAKKWIEDKDDDDALATLLNSHLRLVAKIAMGYRGYGLPYADLIAEGNIGLMMSLNKFDPERGFRFSTYARWWIQASIQDYILKNWSLVKVATTAAQKKLFFNLRQLKNKLGAWDENALSPEIIAEISKKLDVSQNEVQEMDKRMRHNDASLNATIGGASSSDSKVEWQDWIASPEENQEEKLIKKDQKLKYENYLNHCIAALSPRETYILKARRLQEPPLTLECIAKELNLSRERIRQIEESAFKKIQKSMKNIAAQQGWAV